MYPPPTSSTVEQEENEINIEDIMSSLEVTEDERQEITREKILDLIANRVCTSTESIKRVLEKIYKKKTDHNIINRL